MAKQFILGDPDNIRNAFQWSSILENLPCSSTYNTSGSLLKKLYLDSLTAAEIAQYVDDLRLIAATK